MVKVMAELGREYRKVKDEMDKVKVKDRDAENVDKGKDTVVDDVVRKLDFLSIGERDSVMQFPGAVR